MMATPRQRIVFGMLALLGAGFSGTVMVAIDGKGWYWVASALLGVALAVLQVTMRDARRRSSSEPWVVAGDDLLTATTYAVGIAFRGSPPDVFAYLLKEGWKIGGCGACDSGTHDGFVTIELVDFGHGRDGSRYRAADAVQRAGAEIIRIGEAIPVTEPRRPS